MVAFRVLSFVAVMCAASLALAGGSENEIDFTESEAKEFLKIGVDRGAVTARFGDPIIETTASDGTVVLVYHRPFVVTGKKESPAPIHFTGFQAFFRDNKLIRWDPITGDSPQP